MSYTLIVSDERFRFTKEQLESDPDNYFTTYFFGSISEASEGKKELVIENEPALFRLIQAHLRGHDVLPIPEGYIPYMSKEVALRNLLKEAEFYALANLVKKIKDFQATTSPNPARPKYKFRSNFCSDIYTRDLTEAEYCLLMSGGGERLWQQEDPALRMDGYRVLWSWSDHYDQNYGEGFQHCAILILDE